MTTLAFNGLMSCTLLRYAEKEKHLHEILCLLSQKFFPPGLPNLGAQIKCVQNRYNAVQTDLNYPLNFPQYFYQKSYRCNIDDCLLSSLPLLFFELHLLLLIWQELFLMFLNFVLLLSSFSHYATNYIRIVYLISSSGYGKKKNVFYLGLLVFRMNPLWKE